MASSSYSEKDARISKSVKLINAATSLAGISELLPTAFYELASSNPGDWINRCDETFNLSSEDRRPLTIGKAHLQKRLKAVESGCLPSDPCRLWVPDTPEEGRTSIFTSRRTFTQCGEIYKSNYKGGVSLLSNTLYHITNNAWTPHN